MITGVARGGLRVPDFSAQDNPGDEPRSVCHAPGPYPTLPSPPCGRGNQTGTVVAINCRKRFAPAGPFSASRHVASATR
jgi:hypothetical protein